MKTKLILVLFSLAVVVFSCVDEKEDSYFDNVNLTVVLTIEDANGTDLLDLKNENAIQSQNIKVFYEINGKRETYASTFTKGATPGNPKGFNIRQPNGGSGFEGKAILYFYSNPTVGKGQVNIIEIKGREDIEIITDVVQRGRYWGNEDIWYEGKSVFPPSDMVISPDSLYDPPYVKVIYK